MPATCAGPCSRAFRSSMRERLEKRPFVDISAYKVRESLSNIESIMSTVAEIIEYVSNSERGSQPVRLGECTSEDKSIWLKDLPSNLARELGFNLIPAIAALSVEGVAPAAVKSFMQSIKGWVHRLLEDCDAVQAATSRSISSEYALMKRGQSSMLRLCNEAFRIADRAIAFCDAHKV